MFVQAEFELGVGDDDAACQCILPGSLKDVKRSFGRNTVRIDFEGDDAFLSDDLVKRHNRFTNYSEIILQDGADSQEMLRRAVVAGVRVTRFELVEPSLNDIFIESVTKTNGEK